MKKIVTKTIVILSLLQGYIYADVKEKPYYFFTELGTSFGGEEVAKNDNSGEGGDNYNAGGGGILGIGTIVNIKDNYLYNARAFVGYRYQGGDGSNSGVVLEGTLFYRISSQISVGIGLHSDFANKTKTKEGEIIEFDRAIGPMVAAEWHFTPQMGLGAKYILIDYETVSRSYDGNQGTVYIQFRF